MLGLMDYTEGGETFWVNKMADYVEVPLTIIFTIEMIIRVLANGLILGSKCYLADPWNWIDFVVVITGLLSFLPQMSNISGLRTFRLFRPLKSLSNFKNMRILIQTLL
jgi:hypothetical protein